MSTPLQSTSPASDKRSWDITQIVKAVHEFEQYLNAVKRRCSLPAGRDWYPYHTFSSIDLLEPVLTGGRRKLLALTEGYPLLDVGCGDGALSFFFESLGLDVEAVDHPATNYNGMEGVRALKAEMKSAVQISEVDLDRQFTLPRQTYGLVLLFGVLYHLKSPLYVLEALSLRAKYCLLSTRVARLTPDHLTELHSIPVAYLVGELETNDDCTNYWIFSHAGLMRLFERTGWRVCDFGTFGSRESDPASAAHDERGFYLLESLRTDLNVDARLGEGWYAREGTCRWTAQRFSFVVPRRERERSAPELYLRFLLPDVLLDSRPSVSLSAHVNGFPLPLRTYTTSGEHVYQEKIPRDAALGETLEIIFETDDVLHAPAPDTRALGVFVPFDGWFPLALV